MNDVIYLFWLQRYQIPRNDVWRFVWDSLRELSLSGQVMEMENPLLIRATHANKVLTKMAKISASVQVKSTFQNDLVAIVHPTT